MQQAGWVMGAGGWEEGHPRQRCLHDLQRLGGKETEVGVGTRDGSGENPTIGT